MNNLKQVIEKWREYPCEMRVGVDVSVRTAKALQKRGLCNFHKTTERSSARISPVSAIDELLKSQP